MRKIWIIACVALIAATAISASAAGSASLTPSANAVFRGATFTVNINLAGVPAGKAASVAVTMDAGLQLTGGTTGIQGLTVTSNLAQNRFVLYSTSDLNFNGVFMTLTFKVAGDAAFSAKNISVTVNDNKANYTASTSISVVCNHNFGNWANIGNSHTRNCSICGTPETGAHNYSNACDNSCNTCGAVRQTSHNYSAAWSANGRVHWHGCTVCGAQKDVLAHTPGPAATEYTPQTCTTCGYVLAAALGHTHKPDGTWLTDEIGHWQKCTTCEDKAEYAEHTYSAECDSTCDTCGYKREVTHTPGTAWQSDGENHWLVCDVCSEQLNLGQHSADLTVGKPECEVCGMQIKHKHNFTDDWKFDDDSHWHACSCGAKKISNVHEWDDGVVTREPTEDAYGEMVFTCTVCGAAETARLIASGGMDKQALLPWVIACGALAVVLVVSLVFFIVIIVKVNKKPVGKYAGKR